MVELNKSSRVSRLVSRTYRRLFMLAIWRAYAPFIGFLSTYLLVTLSGLVERIPEPWSVVLRLTALIICVILALRGLRRFRAPPVSDAIAALDRQSEWRPLSSLQDRTVRHRTQSETLWRAHQLQLTEIVTQMRVPWFASQWRDIDPFYLRYLIPVSLTLMVVLNATQLQPRLIHAMSPDMRQLISSDTVQTEAWIIPPDYSGKAPVFLSDRTEPQTVPAGSDITLRAQAPSRPVLLIRSDKSSSHYAFEPTPDGAYEISARLDESAQIEVRWWGIQASWQILVAPDQPPEVSFVDLPEHMPTDRTAFSWQASDDYGINRLDMVIRPLGRQAEADIIPVMINENGPAQIEQSSKLDLTQSRWAGAQVEVYLQATDGAGQTGRSAAHRFTLPDRLMIIPLARAIQDVRLTLIRETNPYQLSGMAEDSLSAGAHYVSATQRLKHAPPGVLRAAIMLEALTYEAPEYFTDLLLYSGLEAARHALATASDLTEAQASQALLWALALRAEYGSSADAYAALIAARNALENALRDGADEAEIKRLMEAFRSAAERYLAARMAEALATGLPSAPDNRDSVGPDGEGSFGGSSFTDMLDALEDLSETGATDQARQLLSDITNLLESLEFQQGQGEGDGFPGLPGRRNSENQDEDRSEEERALSETMQELLDILRDQRDLNDETLAQQRGEGGLPEPGDPSQPGGTGSSLAERQRDLAEGLSDLAEQANEGEGAGELLDEEQLEAIMRAQRRAGRALESENQGRAIRNQEQATGQLRDLAETLAGALDEMEKARRGLTPGERQQARDPFGNAPQSGNDDSNRVNIPDLLERDRARKILEELRRRYDEAEDEAERDYLERLLDRF